MDLETREEHEGELEAILALLLAEARPAFERGDIQAQEKLKRDIEHKVADHLSVTFLIAALALADQTGTAPANLESRAAVWAGRRAESLASDMVENTARRVREAIDSGSADNLQYVFSPERARAVALTETTEAVKSGEFGFRDAAERGEVEDIAGETDIKTVLVPHWVHTERNVPGRHPCPQCEPLVGKPEWEWEQINPAAANGPPLHPNCDCSLSWEPMPEEYASRQFQKSLLNE